MLHIPILRTCDVLVFGAPSSTVAAALAARDSGRSVMAVSDMTYFGQETAGALQLWPKASSTDPLYREIFDDAPSGLPPSPTKVKRVFETALLDAGIPFLFDCRPVMLLRDTAGTLAGVVLAYRTSLCAILCRVVIDTSLTGIVARLAGLSFAPAQTGTMRSLTVLGPEPPADAPFEWEKAGTPFVLQQGDKETHVQAYRCRIPITTPRSSFADRVCSDHIDRSKVFYPGLYYTADTWVDTGYDQLAEAGAEPVDDAASLPDDALVYADGRLVIGSPVLPLTAEGTAQLMELSGQLELGRRIGAIAGKLAAGLPQVPEDQIARRPTIAGAAGQQTGGDFRFSEWMTRPSYGHHRLEIDIGEVPVLDSCEVMVVGGGTAGAPAAIAAARERARTIVLERRHGLGGVSTLGLISGYYWGNRVGFTAELDRSLKSISADPDRINPVEAAEMPITERLKKHPGRSGWIPEEKMGWYARQLRDAGAQAWFSSFAFGVRVEGRAVTGVLVSTPYGAGLVLVQAVIDATGNADIAAAGGAPVRLTDARHVAVQGSGLSPRQPRPYGRNSDHTFVDETDPADITHAYVNARTKFRDQFDVSPIIGTRERRQIIGEIELSPLDFLAGRTFPDTIAQAWSNFDSHGFTVHPVFLIHPPDKEGLLADVPYRCTLPKGLEGVAVTGLGMSAHRDALPVIRMQADLQNLGYAVGLAAAMSARAGVGLREVDMSALQKKLVEMGILDPAAAGREDSFPMPVETVKEVVRRGPRDLYSAAVILGHPDISVPLLLEILQTSTDEEQRLDAALILGLLGREEAAPVLAAVVDAADWDQGWNYTGMGQFGFSMSRVDSLVVALGTTRSPLAVEPLIRKIRALDETSAFSHCRAVSLAASRLGDNRLAEPLYELLNKPGMQGHAHLDTREVIARANPELNETEARNASLKELILARGLYLCGDWQGLGRRILETYAHDLRGHYARHAQAVLEHADLDSLRAEVM